MMQLSISKILLSIFIFSLSCNLGQVTLLAQQPVYELAYGAVDPVDPVLPIEKVKPKEKKKNKISKHKLWKQEQEQKTEELKKPALTSWLIFTMAMVALVIALSFVIGFGMLQWSIAAYIMLGAELAAFATIMSILWGDRPSEKINLSFTAVFLSLIITNVLVGIGFIIWGLLISWPFGWMIGLILIFLAGLFLLIHWLIKRADAKKSKTTS